MLKPKSDCRNTIRKNQLMIEGSPQWVISRNITSTCKIDYMDGNMFELLKICKPDEDDSIPLM